MLYCKTYNQLSDITATDLETQIKERKQALELKFMHTKYEDKTSMLKDWEHIKSYADNKNFFQQLTRRVRVGFVDEADNYRIINLQGFLTSNFYPLSILCLIGHGVTADHAKTLRNAQVDEKLVSPAWNWRLDRCSTFGEGYTPQKMCQDVKKGDLAVFHCGFLTPQWVLEQLKQREKKKKTTTLILLIDSCFSGTWIEQFEQFEQLDNLEYTRVIIQTACTKEEVSFGQYFLPLWVKLQEPGSGLPLEEASQEEIPFIQQQHPSFHISHRQDLEPTKLPSGCVKVEIEGKTFKFFDNGDYFHKLSLQSYKLADHSCMSRGIPQSDIPKLLEDFRGDLDSITFLCFKLKIYKGEHGPPQYQKTPFGLLLIDWKHGDGIVTLFLHLHFNEFASPLKLGRLSNIYVVPKDIIVVGQIKCILEYEEDLTDKKDQILLNDDDKDCIASKFTQFVSKYKGDPHTWCFDKGLWNMTQAEPYPWIRSRSAILESILM